MKIAPLLEEHYPAVAEIYKKGLASGIASFETEVPSWKEWNDKFLPTGRLVGILNGKVVGWCVLSATSKRTVYSGVAENTIYIDPAHHGQGFGKKLLSYLVELSEDAGYWSLYAGIFTTNIASIKLHEDCGFRTIGIREKIGKRNGVWYDNIIMERRSKKVNYVKNILVLCTGNSCRSQMAHGYIKEFAGTRAAVFSAGIETHGLNRNAVKFMAEDGIDISGHTSNHVDEYSGIDWDFIITVCDHANENCPFIPAPKAIRLHHNFTDPSKVKGSEEEISAAFIKTRNEIKEYCRKFMEDNLQSS